MAGITTTREIENFGRNVRFCPRAYYEPTSESDVLQILNRHAGEKIRVVGKLHSWSKAFETDGIVISLKHFNEVVLVNQPDLGSHAWIGAGIQIKHLIRVLARQGRTLPSLGLITEQTVVGAISTGTHGSGRHCLSHFAEAFRVARFDRVSQRAIIEEIDTGDELRAAQCSVGNLGVILSVKMRCRNRYNVEEFWYPYSTLEQVLRKENEYPLQQFFLIPWQWQFLAQHRRETQSGPSGPEWLYRVYFFLCIDILLHSILVGLARIPGASRLTPSIFRGILSRSVIKNWKITGDSSRMLIMEQELFRHIETELFVQRNQLADALEFVRYSLDWSGGADIPLPDTYRRLLEKANLQIEFDAMRGAHCHHFPICVRRILADDTLLSMTSGGNQDWYSISLISYDGIGRRDGFLQVVAFLSRAMARLFGARPHWGKHVPLSSQELTGLYPHFHRFRDLCIQRDPDGVFRNEWFEQLFSNIDTR